MTDDPTTARDHLRHATAAAHERLEQLLGLDRDPDLPHYQRVLLGFGLFLSSWEPAVHAALPAGLHPWLAARSRSPMLWRDIDALGLTERLSSLRRGWRAEPRVRQRTAVRLADPVDAWGSLYVLEGSALGGQVVARRLAQTLALGPEDGAAWFHGHGARTGALWADFRQRLEAALGDDPGARVRAAQAASRTFDALHATFVEVMADARVAA